MQEIFGCGCPWQFSVGSAASCREVLADRLLNAAILSHAWPTLLLAVLPAFREILILRPVLLAGLTTSSSQRIGGPAEAL